jgi:hypothetical protein
MPDIDPVGATAPSSLTIAIACWPGPCAATSSAGFARPSRPRRSALPLSCQQTHERSQRRWETTAAVSAPPREAALPGGRPPLPGSRPLQVPCPCRSKATCWAVAAKSSFPDQPTERDAASPWFAAQPASDDATATRTGNWRTLDRIAGSIAAPASLRQRANCGITRSQKVARECQSWRSRSRATSQNWRFFSTKRHGRCEWPGMCIGRIPTDLEFCAALRI